MNLNLTFSHAKPTKPGRYMAYFPNLDRYDVTTIAEVESSFYKGEFYLHAVGRGGNYMNWNCLWSESF